MTAGWSEQRLGDVVTRLTNGYVGPTRNIYRESGIPYLLARHVKNNRLAFDGKTFVSDEFNQKNKKSMLKAGDVLLVQSGHIGHTAVVTKEHEGHNCHAMIVITPVKDAITGPFLSLYFNSSEMRQRFDAIRSGSTVPHLTCGAVKEIKIPVPPLAAQRRIVGILDEAFEGIATAKANAEKNLQNARALFESHLQAVFTQRGAAWDRMTLAVLLDRGWIESHLDGNHGGEYPRKHEFISNGVPYISANCLDDERIDMARAKYLSPKRAALLRKGIAKDGDVLFAHNATVGPVAILYTDEKKVILGTSLTYYRCNRRHILPEYLAHYMRSFGFKSQYLRVMRQSTRNQVPITKQREFYHVIPPLDEQKAVVGELDGLFEYGRRLAAIYQWKLGALDELKRSLLHQAFSAQLATGKSVSPASSVITFPITIPNITTTDLHAGILGMAYRLHEKQGKQVEFTHVKAEKIAHMIEARVGIDLGREPVKDAAGPNDFPHLKKVEHRAKMAGYFDFKPSKNGSYSLKPLGRFDQLIGRTKAVLGDRYKEVEDLLRWMLPFNVDHAEVVATVFAAWNNLLMDGKEPTDDEIVFESRENWRPEKLTIERWKFFEAVAWLRKQNVVPEGKGKRVNPKRT